MRKWLQEGRADLRIQHRLTQAAEEWERLGKDESALYRGLKLKEATQYETQNPEVLNALEREFLEHSQEAEVSERKREDKRRALVDEFRANAEKLAKVNAEMERLTQIGVRTNQPELQKKIRELQTALNQQQMEGEITRSRGEIYASIIHDINGPLTIVSGLLQIIHQRIGDENHLQNEQLEDVKDLHRRITRQISNCTEISRRYLSFLRKNPHEIVPVSVNQVLLDLRELLHVHPSARNNQLLIQPMVEDAFVLINGTDLIQILLNLVINAFQCTPTHHCAEVSAQLLLHPMNLTLPLFRDGPKDRFKAAEGFKNEPPLLRISVHDDGPGISPEIMSKIFQPYFSTGTKPQGPGLGLCLVERLLKQAHGAVHIHTELGRGTTGTIYLPTKPQIPGTRA